MLTIGEFSKIGLVTTKTLRYYDEKGLLKPAHVDAETGYRYYKASQLKTLLLISRLKDYCFTLKEIADVLQRPQDDAFLLAMIREKQRYVRLKLLDYQSVLDRLQLDLTNLERGMDIMSGIDNMMVKMVDMPPMNVLYFRAKINVDDYGRHIGKLFETIVAQNLTTLGPPMSIHHGEEYDPENYDMEIAIPIKEKVEATREFAPGRCANVTLAGPYSQLPAVYAHMKQWMDGEGLSLRDAPFEIYLTDPAQTKPEGFITEVYFPAK